MKLLFVSGMPGVGKTSIIISLTMGVCPVEYHPTSNFTFTTDFYTDEHGIIPIQLSEIGSQTTSDEVLDFRKSDVVILVASYDDITSISSLRDVLDKAIFHQGNTYLIINKNDCQCGIDVEEINRLKEGNDFKKEFYLSSKDEIGVKHVFEEIIRDEYKAGDVL